MFKNRPWGFWLVLWQWPLFSKGPRYKLKFLYFKKGGAISMQRHKLRSEVWRFVSGDGLLVWGLERELDDMHHLPVMNETRDLKVEIRPYNWHQYTAETPTLVLETQRGICREDDIERI